MKKKFIAKTAYVLMLCLAISSVAFTSSVDVYEQYYQGLFETIDMLYYRDLGFNNIQGTALNGVMENLNEYSCFVLNDNDNPINSGAGVFLEKIRNGLRVVSVLPDTTASAAGIKSGDVITLIDKMSTSVMSEDAFNYYISSNGSALINYIDMETGFTKSTVLEADTTGGRDVEFVYLDGAGYIRINSFSEFATARFKGILESMKTLGNTRLILDLRSLYSMNIEDAAKIADSLVSRGTIAEVKGKTYNAATKVVDFEIAVLIDENTVGAAEAIAMAVSGTVYGQESKGYAVYTKSYPVFNEESYAYYSNMSGETELSRIFNYLKSRNIEIEDTDITGYLNIVESGIKSGNRKLINENNNAKPDIYVTDTEMGYLNYTPGSYMIDIERDYREGSVNYDIYIAKKILGFLGFFNGEYNVVYNNEFTDAVNRYKSVMGFIEDGVLDMDTQSSLNTYSMKTAVSEDECVKQALSGFEN